jgi:hypothetical protein
MQNVGRFNPITEHQLHNIAQRNGMDCSKGSKSREEPYRIGRARPPASDEIGEIPERDALLGPRSRGHPGEPRRWRAGQAWHRVGAAQVRIAHPRWRRDGTRERVRVSGLRSQ